MIVVRSWPEVQVNQVLMGRATMLDILSVFEKLSRDVILDRGDVVGKFESLPVAMRYAFERQSSKMLRSVCASCELFSDANGVY